VIKKIFATAAAAVSVAGVAASVAPAAMADGNRTTTANGNGSGEFYGNVATGGYMSPSFALISGSFNKPCIALPRNVQSLVAIVPIGIQDSPILSQQQDMTCTQNSSQVQGDAPLSHFLENFPLLSDNGKHNH
jgi:hypothetical protein